MSPDDSPAAGLSVRLPAPPFSPLTWDPLGGLVMRPWYDRLAVKLVAGWYLGMSRAWAAALESGGDPARFAAEVGLEALPKGLCGWSLARGLAATTNLARVHAGADAHWRDVFFGPGQANDGTLVAAERRRRQAAHDLMAARRHFACLRRRIEPLCWALPRPDQMPAPEALAADGGTCIARGDLPTVELSRWVPGPHGRQAWLRFASPGLPGDTAWAEVFEPEGAVNPPTLISLHGICVESEQWSAAMDAIDIAPTLTRKGLRVIRPEGPWHGRRRPAGRFGGEPAMAQGPLGFLKLFRAWGAEVAVLIDWARQQGSGPVALGGVSLGALTSQLTAVAANDWPAALRPDALILIACSENLKDVAFNGSLAARIGLPARLAERGWTEADIARYLPLMEPRGRPVMAPEKIVMVLGEADDLTTFEGGLALARRWQVPPANLFLRRQGHFSVAFDLARRPQPLDRLAEILGQG
ncbi:MAG TPA: alpha/beta hydrolase family protein [Kiloniellaceae bacterium]|nr:alpha/beta hydrolase family protein [Kiloniellaceae bacterium]